MHAKRRSKRSRMPASASAPRVTHEEAESVERQLELARAERAERFALGLCDSDGFATKAGLLEMLKGTLAGFNPPPKKRGSLLSFGFEVIHGRIETLATPKTKLRHHETKP